MQYLEDLLTRYVEKCLEGSPTGGITVDTDLITVDSDLITVDTTEISVDEG